MGGIVPTKKPRIPRFDGNAIARVIKALVPGAIVERTGRGIDMNGQPFAPYSKRYQSFLRRGGEDPKVDLRLSGGLMNSIKARGMDVSDHRVVIRIGPDTGTSPVWRPKSGGRKRYERAMRKFEKGAARGDFSSHIAGRQASRAYSMQRTGSQSPPHNIVAHWLHYGTARIKARPFLGLTPEQTQMLFREIQKVMFRMR